MKLLFIGSASSIHTIRWIKYFSDKNQIHLISFSKPNHETSKELEKINKNIRISYFINISGIIESIYFLIYKKYSLVHIHYLGWHSLLSIFIKSKTKLVVTPWGSDILKNRTLLKNFWLRILFKRADFLICDSERLENEAIKLGMNKNKTFISMFGVDTNLFKKSRKIFADKFIYKVGR